jgi:hypothetical protein
MSAAATVQYGPDKGSTWQPIGVTLDGVACRTNIISALTLPSPFALDIDTQRNRDMSTEHQLALATSVNEAEDVINMLIDFRFLVPCFSACGSAASGKNFIIPSRLKRRLTWAPPLPSIVVGLSAENISRDLLVDPWTTTASAACVADAEPKKPEQTQASSNIVVAASTRLPPPSSVFSRAPLLPIDEAPGDTPPTDAEATPSSSPLTSLLTLRQADPRHIMVSGVQAVSLEATRWPPSLFTHIQEIACGMHHGLAATKTSTDADRNARVFETSSSATSCWIRLSQIANADLFSVSDANRCPLLVHLLVPSYSDYDRSEPPVARIQAVVIGPPAFVPRAQIWLQYCLELALTDVTRFGVLRFELQNMCGQCVRMQVRKMWTLATTAS